MHRSILLALLLLIPIPSVVWAQCATTTEAGKPFVWVDEADLVTKCAGPVVHLSCDTVWGLKERIYVVDPSSGVPTGEKITELYVEAGTIFKGGVPGDTPSGTDYATGGAMGGLSQVSALVIGQGGYAEMTGSDQAPIVMTWWQDDVDDPYDLALPARGKWGGLIILGRAKLDCQDPQTFEPCDTMVRFIEGIPEADADYVISTYGCDEGNPSMPCDDEDDSGDFYYISVRHGGFEIGEANEINGLTMGAVGAGTEIHHIEIFNNDDDGFEWFGGTVNAHHLVSAMNKDDCFDMDQGFRGYGQFWFAIAGIDKGDHGGEHDGQEIDYCRPLARPDIANVTYMGSGRDNIAQGDQTHAFLLRDDYGCHYLNSIFLDYPQKYTKIEDLSGSSFGVCDYGSDPDQDSEMRCVCGDLDFRSTFWWDFGDPQSDASWMDDYLFTTWSNNTESTDPQLISYPPSKGTGGNCRELGNQTLYPVPASSSPVLETNGAVLDPLTSGPDTADPNGCVDDLQPPAWYQKVPYAGAFDPNAPMWTDGWTFLYQGNYTPNCPVGTEIGNANGSTQEPTIDIDDVVYLIAYIFSSGPAPVPYPSASGDANCSCLEPAVDIDDVVYLIAYIFSGGPAPCSCEEWVATCGQLAK